MTELPDFIRGYVNLAQPRLGAEVIAASDDFFAPRHRLIKPEEPVFIADKYDDHGKWMDGWESRRRRGEGHDHCIVKICPGTISGIEIDTRHFTGNYPPQASLDACSDRHVPDQATAWTELVPQSRLKADRRQFFPVNNDQTWTYVRLNIYPDGGVARLRIYGRAYCDWSRYAIEELVDLAAMTNGGRALDCNDMHYGHMNNLIAPGRGVNMGDGWETRRRRVSGNDWVILKLGHAGSVRKVKVDTAFFKGNYPESCCLRGALLGDAAPAPTPDYAHWQQILPRQPLQADQVHLFEDPVIDVGPVDHVLFNIYPDGGVSRLRLWGQVQRP